MEAGAVSSGWRPSRGAAARQTAAGRAPRPLLLPRCSPMAAAGRRFGADAAPSQPRPLLAAAWPQQQLAAQHAARCAAGSCGGSSGRGARAGGRCTPHRSRVRVAAAFEAEATTTSGSSSGGGGAAGLAPPGNEQQQQQQQSGSEARDGGSAGASSTGGSGAKDVRSFDLHLPPSSSGSTGLEELDDVELRQQAQDWGYEQLGRPFPEGISLPALAETLDDRHFQIDLRKAFGGLLAPLALVAAGCAWQAYMHAVCPMWQQVVCWLAVGTGYFGLFQAAVDCAHFAFWPQEPAAQDVIGAVLMAPALIPYEGWRLQYFNHLLRPNMLGQDSPMWHPLTADEYSSLPAWRRALARVVTATPLRFAARALAGWAAAWDGLDLRRHPPAQRRWVLAGWAVPAAFVALAFPAMLAAGGLERLVGWWLMPWLVFQTWQGLLVVASSTAPHIPFVPEGLEYDHGQAVVNGTVSLLLPPWLERIIGHANHTLPRTLSISIPRYNLGAADVELRSKLAPYLTEARLLNPTLLLNLMTRWLVFDAAARRYLDFDAAEARRGGGGGGVSPAAA